MKEYNGKYLTIMLCSQCNNDCKHCYIKYNGRFSDDELNKIIPILTKKYIVLLNGTEPILFKEYFPFYRMTGGHHMLTNGIEILNNPKILDVLKENGITEIGLSYHFGIHDEISKIKTEDLNRVIELLKENEFTVRLMCSLSNDNYKGIEQYCEEAYRLGVDKIKFTNFISQGNAQHNFAEKNFLRQEQIDEVLSKIDYLRTLYDKDVLEIQRCGTFGPNKSNNNFSCAAGNNLAVLTPDGKVYDCIFNINGDNNIGYIDEEGRIMINDNPIHNETGYCKVLKKYNHIG